jgi:hypothetical protein
VVILQGGETFGSTAANEKPSTPQRGRPLHQMAGNVSLCSHFTTKAKKQKSTRREGEIKQNCLHMHPCNESLNSNWSSLRERTSSNQCQESLCRTRLSVLLWRRASSLAFRGFWKSTWTSCVSWRPEVHLWRSVFDACSWPLTPSLIACTSASYLCSSSCRSLCPMCLSLLETV